MAKIHDVTPQTLQEWFKNRQAVIIDVREPAEVKALSIEGSISLPLSQMKKDQLIIPEHEGKKLVFHCASGRRSMMVCEELLKQGVKEDIWNLAGGINEWVAQGQPVNRDLQRYALPLERQIQLTLGILLIISTLLTFFVHPYWLLLPFLIGLGLTNTGITGWCGLGILLTKMPWNRS